MSKIPDTLEDLELRLSHLEWLHTDSDKPFKTEDVETAFRLFDKKVKQNEADTLYSAQETVKQLEELEERIKGVIKNQIESLKRLVNLESHTNKKTKKYHKYTS